MQATDKKIQSFIDHWHDVYKKYKKLSKKNQSAPITFVPSKFDIAPYILHNHKFMSPVRQKHILAKYNHIYDLRTNQPDHVHVICVFDKASGKKEYMQFIHRILNRIIIMANVNEPLNIILIFGRERKIYEEPLTTDNVNSGYSQHKHNNIPNTIVIWRTEEMEKVLLHELVHANDQDLDLDLPEDAVEALAEVQHIIFLLIERGEPFKEFIHYYKRNLEWSIKMAKKFANANADVINKHVDYWHYFIMKTSRLIFL
jgi:hypothetical protein